MKVLPVLLCLLSGCYYFGQNTYHDVAVNPSSDWSPPEQLTIIIGAGNHNLLDYRTNIKAIATPYFPSVVKAIGRRAQIQYHWTEEYFRSYVDNLIHDGSAMFIDWDKTDEPVYDSRLQPLVSPEQFDSLMVLLTLKNSAWPCGKHLILTMSGDLVYIPLDNPDCMPPDITNIESKVFLVNEQDEAISPASVWGRKMNYLTNIEETLFLKFKLRDGDHHFFRNSRKFYLLIKGLEGNIRLELSTTKMK